MCKHVLYYTHAMITRLGLANRKQLLADIATLYYVEKKTQAEIATLSGYSRSAISRLLAEAEKAGIVQFSINYPLQQNRILENRLKEEFGLEAAFVLDAENSEYGRVLEQVGRLGAGYLQQVINDNQVIGVGWGSTLFELVNALPTMPHKNVQVVQVIGATGGRSDQRVDGPDLATLLADKLNASHKYLHAPAYLDNAQAARSIIQQKQIHDALESGYSADIILLGIGTIDVDPLSSVFRTGYLSVSEVLDIQKGGGVCNFCGVILDADGRHIENEINQRVVATDIRRLQKNGCSMVGIAAGSKKIEAIKAVLKGNWLKVLITDSIAANGVL